MELLEIVLEDFRNFRKLETPLSRGLTIITGANGQGKTNLLEAVGMLSMARSHRTRTDTEAIAFGAEVSRIRGGFSSPSGSGGIELTLRRGGGKTMSFDDSRAERLSDAVGKFRAVVLSPEDCAIVRGGPEDRRRHLDAALSLLRRDYLATLRDLMKIMARKKVLLSVARAQGGRVDVPAVRAIDAVMAPLVAEVVMARSRFVRSMSDRVRGYYGLVAGIRADVEINYRPCTGDAPADDLQGLTEATARALKGVHPREVAGGMVLFGPQRDDFEIMLAGRQARRFASLGEARSLALGMKLHVAAKLGEAAGDSPVILMDDVLGELDRARRAAVLGALPQGAQILLATSDPESLPAFARADMETRVLRIEAGRIVK